MTLRLNGSTSGYVEIDAPAVAGTSALTLPTGVGTLLTAEGGKVLQVVRATDTTDRTTTSGSFVDAGISVTITPQKNTSAIILINTFNAYITRNSTAGSGFFSITDNSNNAISGAQSYDIGFLRFAQSAAPAASGVFFPVNLIAYATPATTSATTYKLRFMTPASATVQIINTNATGQMYAIEVSA